MIVIGQTHPENSILSFPTQTVHSNSETCKSLGPVLTLCFPPNLFLSETAPLRDLRWMYEL